MMTCFKIKFLFKNLLKLGMKGEDVRQLQLKLKQWGYFTYPTITSYFGNVTATAVKKFQAINHLPAVSSSILTIHAIDDEIANTYNAELVKELSSSPFLRQIYLGNSYHMITVDNERETVAAEACSFLDLIYGKIQPDPTQDKILSPELQRFIRNLDRGSEAG